MRPNKLQRKTRGAPRNGRELKRLTVVRGIVRVGQEAVDRRIGRKRAVDMLVREGIGGV